MSKESCCHKCDGPRGQGRERGMELGIRMGIELLSIVKQQKPTPSPCHLGKEKSDVKCHLKRIKFSNLPALVTLTSFIFLKIGWQESVKGRRRRRQNVLRWWAISNGVLTELTVITDKRTRREVICRGWFAPKKTIYDELHLCLSTKYVSDLNMISISV